MLAGANRGSGPMTCTSAGGRRASIGNWGWVLAAAVLATAAAPRAPAQTAPPQTSTEASSEEGAGLQQVVVSALRRTENLQAAPVAVTSLSQEDLDKQMTLSLADLNGNVPGLAVVGGDPGQSQFSIRGLSSAGGDLTTSPTVGYYFNDTPVTTNYSAEAGQIQPSYYDLARVEVLRGPQGTLYGASAMGGTIRLIFNEPELNKLDGKVSATLSDTEFGGWNYEVDGLLNAPLVTDTMALRVSAYSRESAGWINRVTSAPGAPENVPPFTQIDDDSNNQIVEGMRASLLFQPNDALSITPEVLYQKTRWSDGSAIDQDLSNGSALEVNNLLREPGTDTTTLPSLTIKGQLPWVDIISNTAYFDRVHSQDQDYSEFVSAALGAGQLFTSPNNWYLASHQFTEEIRATSRDSGPFHWQAGAFYLRNHNTDDQTVYVDGLSALTGGSVGGIPVIDDLAFSKAQTMITTQKAVFGELSYDILSNLTATAGLRHFDITNDFHRYATGLFNGGTSQVDLEQTAEGNTPKFLLSYQMAPGDLLYASATKGFRAGGVNEPVPANLCAADLAKLGLTAAPLGFNPDSVWSYEVGAKTDWADNRLRVNAALYDIEWTDIQVPINLPDCGFPFTSNSGKARSRGAELELSAAPVQGLLLNASFSYDQAQLTQDIPYEPGTDGQALLEVPKMTGSASVEYSFPISGEVTGAVRADYKYYGSVLQGYIVAPNQTVSSYDTVGAGFSLSVRQWRADFFARNVTDERGFYSTAYLPVAIHDYDRGWPILPRMVGLTLTYQY